MAFWWTWLAPAVPLCMALMVLTGAMVYVGESIPLEWAARIQRDNPSVLYRPQFGNRDQQFKEISITLRRPEIITIGSSRILQFRAGFFNKRPEAFYNAAGPGWRLEQVTRVIYGLEPEALPRTIILAIDPPWFQDGYEGYVFPKEHSDLGHMAYVNLRVIRDFMIERRDFRRSGFHHSAYVLRQEPSGAGQMALGLRAIRDGHGFRSDGSEQYGDFLVARWLDQAQMRNAHLLMLQDGEGMYLYGDTVSPAAMGELAALLDYAAAHGVEVIGLLPPYMTVLWSTMMQTGNHTYIPELTSQLKALFESRGFPLFNFSDGLSVDTPDSDFFDGWHASELSNLRMYLKILEVLPDTLGMYSDYTSLAHLAATAPDPWNVFGFANEYMPRCCW